MIYLNCNKLPSSGQLASMVNSVTFENVKTEYRANEDIVLEYTLDSETQASSRNWIGLYAKGATTLEQYVTFEWTISKPKKESSKKHFIVFCYKYHIKNIEPDKEYFFIFVNKQMKVLGSSSYFHFNFYPLLEIEDPKIYEKLDTYISSTPESLTSFTDGNKVFPQIINEKEITMTSKDPFQSFQCKSFKCSNKHPQQLLSTHINETISPNNCGFKTDITLTSPDFPLSINSGMVRDTESCSLCKQPSNFIQKEQKLHAKIKVHAEYAHTLEKRIEELEKCLEMSQVAQKQLKLAAHHAKREKVSYQKFVNELMTVLATKGAVRILDGQGTELLLKRIVPENEDNSLIFKTSQRERILKSVITSQEKTIQDLIMKIGNGSSVRTENISSAPFNAVDDINITNETEHCSEREEDMKQKPFNGNVQAVITVYPQQKLSSEKRIEEEKSDLTQSKQQKRCYSADEYLEEDLLENVLNETYSIETTVGDPVSVILPADVPQYPKVAEDQSKRSISDFIPNINNQGQGDYQNNSVQVKANVHDVRQSMMKELRNVIHKRQEDKGQTLEKNPTKIVSNNSLNFPIHEIIECKNVEEQNALIIKGDHLQYAIIR